MNDQLFFCQKEEKLLFLRQNIGRVPILDWGVSRLKKVIGSDDSSSTLVRKSSDQNQKKRVKNLTCRLLTRLTRRGQDVRYNTM